MIPSSSASLNTVASTWREEAPSVRSIPNSRVRWATVIENVLKIRNAPTNTEIPAKTSRNVVRKPKPSLMSADCWAASSAPVFASASCGRTALIRVESSSGETPLDASTSMLSSSPTFPVIRCASGRVKSAKLAPPRGIPEPNRPIPDSVYSLAPRAPLIVIFWPTW